MNEAETAYFKKYVKKERERLMATPFDIAYESFIHLGYDKKNADFFVNNASLFVENMRNQCWIDYNPHEINFTNIILSNLIDENKAKRLTQVEAINDYILKNSQKFYILNLSNTQSRRSRAGKEFEAILELLFIGAKIPADAQKSISDGLFTSATLGKLVDLVSPGYIHYSINKAHTALISAKTTLRERWAEVAEEIKRTGMPSIYLATLDSKISDKTLELLYNNNIIIVTTQKNINIKYKNSKHVEKLISFEKLLKIASRVESEWDNYTFSKSQFTTMKNYLEMQVKKHTSHKYVYNFYKSRIKELNYI